MYVLNSMQEERSMLWAIFFIQINKSPDFYEWCLAERFPIDSVHRG